METTKTGTKDLKDCTCDILYGFVMYSVLCIDICGCLATVLMDNTDLVAYTSAAMRTLVKEMQELTHVHFPPMKALRYCFISISLY